MKEEKKERDYFLKYLHKKVSISRKISDEQSFFYRGVVTGILNNKLILDDLKSGQIIFSFDEIDFINILEEQQDG